MSINSSIIRWVESHSQTAKCLHKFLHDTMTAKNNENDDAKKGVLSHDNRN
jgi:hypothetical protein